MDNPSQNPPPDGPKTSGDGRIVTLQEYAEIRGLVVPAFSSEEPACFAPRLTYAAVKYGWFRQQRITGDQVKKSVSDFDRLVEVCE